MTQQPYPPQQYPQPGYPQQYPQQPMQQGYPAQPQQPYAPPAQYTPPMGQPQGYPQAPMGQQPPPAPPAQSGSIDDYYNQAVAAGGPGISWKDKPIGTTYAGIIASRPTVQQDSDYTTKLPKFQRDGVTPLWVMLIPLERVQSNYATPNGQPEHPTGEVVFYARGKDKEELNRAMAEAGCSGAPQAGATFQVTLVERKPQRQGNPKNVVRISYTPPNGQAHGPSEQAAPAPAPAQEAVAAPPAPAPQQFQPQAPAPQPVAPQQAQTTADGGYAQQAYQQVTQQPQVQAPVQQEAPQQWTPPAPPQAQQPMAPQPPAGVSPEAAAILQGLGVAAQQG